jgi:hypothetical protein
MTMQGMNMREWGDDSENSTNLLIRSFLSTVSDTDFLIL